MKAFRNDPSPRTIIQFPDLHGVLTWESGALDEPSERGLRKLQDLGFVEELRFGLALTKRGADHILGSVPLKNLYVIRLDDAVKEDRRFKSQNRDYDGKRPCMYVGSTGRSPRERFEQHKSGYKSSRAVKAFGKYIMWKKFVHLNPLPSDEAVAREAALAHELRRRGYGVWQA